MSEVVIGIDVGTTNVKVAAFDVGGAERARVHRATVPFSAHDDRHEINVASLTAALTDALHACVHESARHRIVAIGVCTAMHGLCGLNDACEPLTNIVTWADGRAVEEAEALGGSDWQVRTGTPVHPMSPFTKLAWFAHHEPALAARVRWWVGVKELVMLALCGELVTDHSSASGTGLLRLGTTTWDPAACAAVDCSPERFARLVPITEVFTLQGSMADALGLERDVPVVIGAGDGPCANLGVGAANPRIAALSVGTSAALRVVASTPEPPDATRFVYTLDDHRWVTGGAISNGGSVNDWLRRVVAPGADDAALSELGSSVPPGSEGLVIRPFFVPERAPRWDASIPASIDGLRGRHGPAHLVRAAVEGVAAQIGLVAESVEALGPIDEVRATGGAFASTLWRKTIAAALGRPLHVLTDIEAGALGSAGIALHAIRRARDPDRAVADLVDPETGFASVIDVVEPSDELIEVARQLRERHRDW